MPYHHSSDEHYSKPPSTSTATDPTSNSRLPSILSQTPTLDSPPISTSARPRSASRAAAKRLTGGIQSLFNQSSITSTPTEQPVAGPTPKPSLSSLFSRRQSQSQLRSAPPPPIAISGLFSASTSNLNSITSTGGGVNLEGGRRGTSAELPRRQTSPPLFGTSLVPMGLGAAGLLPSPGNEGWYCSLLVRIFYSLAKSLIL